MFSNKKYVFLLENSPESKRKKVSETYLNQIRQLQPELLCLNLFFTCFHENIICMQVCILCVCKFTTVSSVSTLGSKCMNLYIFLLRNLL